MWGRSETKFIFGHVLLNFFIAVVRTARDGSFNLRKLGGFIFEKLLPYTGVFAIALEFQEAIGLPGISTVVWALIQTSLLAQTVENFERMGIMLPKSISTLVQDRYYTEPNAGMTKRYEIEAEEHMREAEDDEKVGD